MSVIVEAASQNRFVVGFWQSGTVQANRAPFGFISVLLVSPSVVFTIQWLSSIRLPPHSGSLMLAICYCHSVLSGISLLCYTHTSMLYSISISRKEDKKNLSRRLVGHCLSRRRVRYHNFGYFFFVFQQSAHHGSSHPFWLSRMA